MSWKIPALRRGEPPPAEATTGHFLPLATTYFVTKACNNATVLICTMFTNYCVEIKFIINLLLSSMDVKEKKKSDFLFYYCKVTVFATAAVVASFFNTH